MELTHPLAGTVTVKRLTPTAQLPRRGSEHAAGYDICCDEDFSLEPGERRSVHTGLSMACPSSMFYIATSRSGLAFKSGVLVHNAPGIIDADYRGELMMLMINTGDTKRVFSCGDRIGQVVFLPFVAPTIEDSDTLPESIRGEGGFGSTGR
jgi:dUTP pyrophosphatase